MDLCSYQKTPEVVDKFVQRAGSDILTQMLHCKTWLLSFYNTKLCVYCIQKVIIIKSN